ncbi:hypothetical protein Hanom_Chr02g00104601 [Helianthus anomalus]
MNIAKLIYENTKNKESKNWNQILPFNHCSLDKKKAIRVCDWKLKTQCSMLNNIRA